MFFVAKSVLFTVLIVMLLQIEVGGRKLETRAEQWVANSVAAEQLRQVAGGAVKLSEDLIKKGRKWAGMETQSTTSRKNWAIEFRRKNNPSEDSE